MTTEGPRATIPAQSGRYSSADASALVATSGTTAEIYSYCAPFLKIIQALFFCSSEDKLDSVTRNQAIKGNDL